MWRLSAAGRAVTGGGGGGGGASDLPAPRAFSLVLALVRVSLKDVILNTDAKLYAQRCSRNALITRVTGWEPPAAKDDQRLHVRPADAGTALPGAGESSTLE